ncbi:MAG: exodeoxyribonuclease III [Dysgonamonadaceae bacterium]|jgi:exodeoxyribonuclease-3|nr:exodeoxyribonuclease III [Dysgonamonadaceae bacterium]
MKIISYNVNGIRSAISKGFYEWLETENPDIICLQETKAQPEQIDILRFKELGYDSYINSAQKKGYSGTAIFSKIKPLSVKLDFDKTFDGKQFIDSYGDVAHEGRITALELADFYLLSVYVPNAKSDLSRLALRHDVWDVRLLEYIAELEKTKPVLMCGDLNVAHREIDLANPKQNEKNAGFTPEEREGFSNFMAHGLVDVFRYFYPDTVKYTWWSMRSNARAKNIGWRIDYFVCSAHFIGKIKSTEILDAVVMSDHCPVSVEI